jgi:PKD repeat protein
MVRYAPDGTLLWRKDLTGTFPSVGRLLVDAGGNVYLAFNSVGDGQDIRLHKYNPSGDLLWSQVISTGTFANDIATSLALSPDETDVALSGNITGGATWITAVYDAATGGPRWLVTAPEGIAARDLVVDASRVYVTGQGNVGIDGFLTVVAYDRATGAKLWRTDRKPADGTGAAGLRMSQAPDGSLVVAGQASRGFLDWYMVAFETTGAVRWEAVRDGGLNTDEIPRGVLVLPDGTTVVTGRGGPNLPGGYIPGVTAGYSPNGTPLWEAFSLLETVWAAALPSGDVCATGGYDALITCFQVSEGVNAVMSATPSTGAAPLSVNFDGSGSTTPNGTIISWEWSFGDGASGTGSQITHVYTTPGTYIASLTVTDSSGGSDTATATIVVTTNGASTGFLSPSANTAQTTGAGDNNGYQTSPANAYADDSAVAIDTNSGTNKNTSYTNRGKDKHTYFDYNFNLPPTAVIQGIEVRLDAHADATSGSPKIYVQLSGDGGATWTAAKSTATLGTTEATYILGGLADEWGRTWSAGDFSNANFRVRIIDVASSTSRDFFLDYVAVNVSYQP